ncbi:MAG TPA: HIT family protein [Lachnospiraceae bacterium]|nr:HIT family protein [Lachnospiraceae bacterium]HAP72363.1 HIT family protein [Lachnospiraceae bacterium]
METEHKDCSYCAEGELLTAFGVKICELPMSKVILFKEQSHPGRVIVACKRHVDDITSLTQEERAQYIEDINKVAVCVHKLFHPDKINFGAYGDTMHHLHVHVVPKYKDQVEWGDVFAMNPHKVEPSQEELQVLIEKFRKELDA